MDNLNLPASSPLDPSIFAHGKRRTALLTGLETPGDQPARITCRDPTRDLLPFCQRQSQRGPSRHHRWAPARRRHEHP